MSPFITSYKNIVVVEGLENMIEFSNVIRIGKRDKKIILNNINFKIDKGEFVYLVGASGSGKSTIFKLIYRDIRATKGKVLIKGTDITKLRNRAVAFLRRKIGVAFQDFQLIETRTVYKNISYSLEIIGKSRKEIDERIEEILKFIDMENKKFEIVSELSIGEKQRISIARAIINNPDILLCDEITANLNEEIKKNILMLLFKLKDIGTTIIFATHDKELIKDFPQRIIELDEGVVVYDD
ncbi:MAG: ATP-binding cassette domain-containing protein [Fusobacteria bacterium]|nr:ATP-binding cassette domain-containing protein [Fusobacteriota bacterium]